MKDKIEIKKAEESRREKIKRALNKTAIDRKIKYIRRIMTDKFKF